MCLFSRWSSSWLPFKIRYKFFLAVIRATCSNYQIFLDSFNCTIFGVDLKSRISLVCDFLQYVTSFVLSPGIFLVTLLLNTLSIGGVFKKRPNFLNSAPTSREGELRLLSAPSGRFWQQTAICPVSLWALIVELHPLNWARAQAARRISEKVIMKELEEQRACVCVCVCEILLQTW